MINSGLVIPIRLTVRQQRYAHCSVGISRFVYNCYVAASRMARRQTGKWVSAYELAGVLNDLKWESDDFRFITEVSKFVAEGARDDFRTAQHNWFNADLPAGPPKFRKKRRTGSGSFLCGVGSGEDTGV